ncbi:hypothetical protein C5167_031111, partial [Papaver somniferum]
MKTRKMAAAAQQEACRYRGNICKILSGDNHLQFCDKHYKFHTDFLRNNPSILKKWHHDLLGSDSTPDLTKKKKRKQAPDQQRSILPPDEERCCRNDGMIWRCKNFRMKTKSYCQQHCTSIFLHNKNRLMKKKKNKKNSGSDFSKKKRNSGSDSNCTKRPGKRQLTDQPSTSNPSTSSDGIVGAGSVKIGAKRKRVERMSGELKSFTGIRETRASKRRKMLMEGGETTDGIVGGASAEIGAKRKRLEKMSGEPKSLTGIRETRASKRWKMLMEGGETTDAIVGGASAEIGSKGKNVERTKGSGEPVIELESVNLYKSNCFELSMEPEKNKVELEKNQVELEKNQVELEKNEVEIEKKKVEVEKNKMEPEKNKMEPEKVEAELEKNEVELETNEVEIEKKKVELEKNKMEPEKIESEARGLQNEITQTGEKQRDENMSKPNAETRGEGSKDSRAYELKAEEKVLNVEEGKGWGCLEERPSQHGSSSQADLEMCKKTFVNLVSDSIDGGDSLGAEDSLGDSMDMLAMKNLNMNKDKMKWNSEADMLSSVEEDPEFCMKAVGALYQQEIPEDEIYPKGLVSCEWWEQVILLLIAARIQGWKANLQSVHSYFE